MNVYFVALLLPSLVLSAVAICLIFFCFELVNFSLTPLHVCCSPNHPLIFMTSVCCYDNYAIYENKTRPSFARNIPFSQHVHVQNMPCSSFFVICNVRKWITFVAQKGRERKEGKKA